MNFFDIATTDFSNLEDFGFIKVGDQDFKHLKEKLSKKLTGHLDTEINLYTYSFKKGQNFALILIEKGNLVFAAKQISRNTIDIDIDTFESEEEFNNVKSFLISKNSTSNLEDSISAASSAAIGHAASYGSVNNVQPQPLSAYYNPAQSSNNNHPRNAGATIGHSAYHGSVNNGSNFYSGSGQSSNNSYNLEDSISAVRSATMGHAASYGSTNNGSNFYSGIPLSSDSQIVDKGIQISKTLYDQNTGGIQIYFSDLTRLSYDSPLVKFVKALNPSLLETEFKDLFKITPRINNSDYDVLILTEMLFDNQGSVGTGIDTINDAVIKNFIKNINKLLLGIESEKDTLEFDENKNQGRIIIPQKVFNDTIKYGLSAAAVIAKNAAVQNTSNFTNYTLPQTRYSYDGLNFSTLRGSESALQNNSQNSQTSAAAAAASAASDWLTRLNNNRQSKIDSSGYDADTDMAKNKGGFRNNNSSLKYISPSSKNSPNFTSKAHGNGQSSFSLDDTGNYPKASVSNSDNEIEAPEVSGDVHIFPEIEGLANIFFKVEGNEPNNSALKAFIKKLFVSEELKSEDFEKNFSFNEENKIAKFVKFFKVNVEGNITKLKIAVNSEKFKHFNVRINKLFHPKGEAIDFLKFDKNENEGHIVIPKEIANYVIKHGFTKTIIALNTKKLVVANSSEQSSVNQNDQIGHGDLRRISDSTINRNGNEQLYEDLYKELKWLMNEYSDIENNNRNPVIKNNDLNPNIENNDRNPNTENIGTASASQFKDKNKEKEK
jgi:hypothetical protein